MLDDSDVDFVILSGGGGSLAAVVVTIVLAIVVAVIVAGNKEDCAKMKCPDGHEPKLMAHECLCVTKAVSK